MLKARKMGNAQINAKAVEFTLHSTGAQQANEEEQCMHLSVVRSLYK
jgi:hypothetical protein